MENKKKTFKSLTKEQQALLMSRVRTLLECSEDPIKVSTHVLFTGKYELQQVKAIYDIICEQQGWPRAAVGDIKRMKRD